MKRFSVLIADDEPLARDTLRDLLAQDPEVETVVECSDGASALENIQTRRPDIAFLDIEMPERGGLEVAAALNPDELPAIVFVTAYGHHAASAFEVEALDYVVKPFSDRRFSTALERAKRRLREQRLGELAEQMAALTQQLGVSAPATGSDLTSAPSPAQTVSPGDPPAFLSRIRVTTGGRTLIVKANDVVWIESDDCYARLHTERGPHLVRASLSSFEQRLDPRCFLRIHRGAIVNIERVVEIEHLFKGARTVVLADGTRLRVSRSRLRRVDEILAPKLGRL
ncbi:MAG: LytTR family DNA-binding domain-containing protein [Acidobacteriota bacterium]